MPDLRRQRRVVYHTKIRLRSPGREKSVVARVQNLSTSGVFVTATDLPEAGTEVLCRMLVAGERCTFKGFVAWVRQPGTEGAADGSRGAGIQFVGVSDREAELLARLIQPDVSDRQSVDCWFEGMSAPIKSHASITDDALSISTKLPFLRLNSPVKVSFTRRGVEEVRSGILEAVTLEPSAEDGIPRLQLTVSTPQSDSAYGTIDVPESVSGAAAVVEGVMVEPRTVVSPMSIETPLPQPVAPPPPASVEVPPAAASAPALAVAGKDRDRTPRVLRPSEPTLVPPVPVPTPPVHREMGMGTKVAMGVVTLGVIGALAYLLTDLNGRSPQPEAAVAPAKAQPRPRPQAAAVAPEPERRPPPVVVVPPPPPPPIIEKIEDPPPPEPEPPTMAIVLVGSAKGMQFYKLTEPPGLVINLPHGYPKPGARVPGGPFKKFSYQRKGQGSQLRVYFTLDQHADVTADGGGLKVTVRQKRARKS